MVIRLSLAEVVKRQKSWRNIRLHLRLCLVSLRGAPAYAGIPVTHRDYSSSVAFVTAVNKPGMSKDDYWAHLAHGPETLCVYMGVKRLPEICDLLIEHGKSIDTPVALVHLGTTTSQKQLMVR